MVYYPSQADAEGIALMGIFHKGKRIVSLKEAVSPVLAVFLLLFISACATERYQGPVSGISANAQLTQTLALGKVVDRLDFSGYSGKKVFLDVVTLTERLTERSPEEAFIHSWLTEKLFDQGVRVVDAEADADLRLTVRARAFGVDRIRRDLPFIYYAEVTRGLADFHFALYDLKEERLLATFDRFERVSVRESFWFYIIGPNRTVD